MPIAVPERKFHFISGLPRSGSTLLAALLRQNPRFYTNISSPLGQLVSANLELMSSGNEASTLVDEEQKRLILCGLFETFYAPMSEEVIFDTNRNWCSKLPLLQSLFPGSKVIACVRDVSWIMDSLERIIRDNPLESSRLFIADAERSTIHSRLESLASFDRLVGFAWSALQEAFYGDQADCLLIVEYELLASAPERVLQLIYEFIGESWCEMHDFNHVQYDAPDFDSALGLPGMHRVRPKVEFERRRTILPPDLFQKFQGMEFWRDGKGSGAKTITAKPVEAPLDKK